MPVRINRCEDIHQARSFKMVRENVTLNNGATVDIDFIRHPGATAIVPLANADTLVMIRQYRHALGEYIWEIPAGTMEPGEDGLECARRELAEETGFSADRWEELGEIVPVPSYSDERIRVFLASGLKPVSGQQKDADEVIEVRKMSVTEVMEMAGRGDIPDSKTLAVLFMARHHIEKRR
ncbi:ADP-ribose pyrophosphatase [Desulfonema ishimotonii]|uniref:GDP-mannose pyrophosphatase n=1 Tax=Desulfonema ishimotonii TaxID=45657 RepID=A0A401G239_9BACT|nr:NUDIX hydrolase [Desulfonema ishimotonii]GBC63253.1 ADP-ribose pyrophosphatase [Desulfonema ishimotonii]